MNKKKKIMKNRIKKKKNVMNNKLKIKLTKNQMKK